MSRKPQNPTIWVSPIQTQLADILSGHRELVSLQLSERVMPKLAWVAFLHGAAEADRLYIPTSETDLVADWAREWILRNRDDESADAEHWRTLSKYVSDPFRHSKRFRFNSQYAIAQVNNVYWKQKALNERYSIIDAICDVRNGTSTGMQSDDPDGVYIYSKEHLDAGTLLEHWSFADVNYDPASPHFEITPEFCQWCLETVDTYSLERPC